MDVRERKPPETFRERMRALENVENEQEPPEPPPERKTTRTILEATILVALIAVLIFILTEKGPHAGIPERPPGGQCLIDKAGLFPYQSESTNASLASIKKQYQIEAVIVTLPSLKGLGTVGEATRRIMSDWKVGNRTANRGILVVYADAEKEVKLEVSPELKDVFSDSFIRSAEELQLGPYFRMGDPEIGLRAVLEEIETRAEIKRQGHYTPETTRTLDANFASGGAGAVGEVKGQAAVLPIEPSLAVAPGPCIFPDSILLQTKKGKNLKFPPARTPAGAYETLKAAFRTLGEPRDLRILEKQEGLPYRVIQNDNRAVVYFGPDQSEEYQPFLFAKTGEGWIFDYINQCRLVVHTSGDTWQIALGDHDYRDLFRELPVSWLDAFDLPWSGDDVYSPENDRAIVQGLLELERLLKKRPDDFEVTLDIGRLGIMVNRSTNMIIPWLERAKTLKPESAKPYFYTAAAYVSSAYETKKAIQELKEGLKREPDNLFGKRLLGYIAYKVRDYDTAIDVFSQVLQAVPHDCYASTYLAHSLLERYKVRRLDADRRAALEALRGSYLEGCGPRSQRAATLWGDLKRGGLLEQSWFGFSYWLKNYRPNQGVLVSNIQKGQPMEQAGLEEGDFLMTFNGQPVHDDSELTYFLAITPPGQRVKMGIVRGALNGREILGDGTAVSPKTYGLNPPQELVLEVIAARRPADK
jgi:tetratricopeptide (TPR) repeat protein